MMADSERLRGFDDSQTDRQTDICDSRVAFATEKEQINLISACGEMCTKMRMHYTYYQMSRAKASSESKS